VRCMRALSIARATNRAWLYVTMYTLRRGLAPGGTVTMVSGE